MNLHRLHWQNQESSCQTSESACDYWHPSPWPEQRSLLHSLFSVYRVMQIWKEIVFESIDPMRWLPESRLMSSVRHWSWKYEIDRTHRMTIDGSRWSEEEETGECCTTSRMTMISFTLMPNSKKSMTFIKRKTMSAIAKAMNKQPVETFLNVGVVNVNRLATLPMKPRKNVIGYPNW